VQMYLMGRTLAKKPRAEVSFIVADYGQDAKDETIEGVRVIKAFGFSDNIFTKIVKFHNAMRHAGSDIVVHRAINTFSGMIALYCRITGKRLIYMLASDYEVDGRYRREQGRFKYFLSSLVFRFANMLIVQNRRQQSMLNRYPVRGLRLFRSGISIDSNNKKDEGFVLWVGRAVPSKRPEAYLELAKRMRQFKFIMILSGDKNKDGLYAGIKEMTARVDNLALIGYVDYSTMDRFYSRAHTFVSTSDMEGFPLTFLEAAKNGVPVVSLQTDPDGFLEEHGCGFCAGGDHDLLEKRVRELFDKPDLYARMSRRAYEYVKENHDIESIVDDLMCEINKIK